jgi:Fe-S-cluster containining protein
MFSSDQTSLHIPQGICFDCSGCGNCCYSWPVPVTDADVKRIHSLAGSDLLFRPLSIGNQLANGSYTHTLEKRSDGRCQFLTQENQCRLHIDYGAEAKPAMCQLFPYTFTPTPSGVYASLSFASTAVLFNSGRALSEQSELLHAKWQLMQSLMPNYFLDWNSIQVVDGQPLDWQNFSVVDEKLTEMFSPERTSPDSLTDLCKRASELCRSLVLRSSDLEKNLTDARPKIVDQILIKYLLDFYFPRDVFLESAIDLPARTIAAELVKPPASIRLKAGTTQMAFGDIIDLRLGSLDKICESLLRRFLYCRLFSKLYFGAGFNHLSLIAGLHHLVFLIALVRIKVKLLRLSGEELSIANLAELVRVLERRLTNARFSRESTVILEVLLSSPSRIERIQALAA